MQCGIFFPPCWVDFSSYHTYLEVNFFGNAQTARGLRRIGIYNLGVYPIGVRNFYASIIYYGRRRFINFNSRNSPENWLMKPHSDGNKKVIWPSSGYGHTFLNPNKSLTGHRLLIIWSGVGCHRLYNRFLEVVKSINSASGCSSISICFIFCRSYFQSVTRPCFA